MPLIAIHPGDHLAEELKALNMGESEFARQLKVPTNRITEILNGASEVAASRATGIPSALRSGLYVDTVAASVAAAQLRVKDLRFMILSGPDCRTILAH